MPRTGLLIGLAAILIAAAVGVLVYTNNFGTSTSQKLASPNPGAEKHGAVGEATNDLSKWEAFMSAISSQGGLAITFADKFAPNWKMPNGHRLERFRIGTNEIVLGRLSSNIPRENVGETWPERGLSFTLPVEWANSSMGHTIEVGIIARQPTSNASDHFYYVYSTQQAGHSGWQQVIVTGQFASSKFEYPVPSVPGGYTNPPVVVIHSDDAGTGKAIEIVGIYVKKLD